MQKTLPLDVLCFSLKGVGEKLLLKGFYLSSFMSNVFSEYDNLSNIYKTWVLLQMLLVENGMIFA